MIWMTEPVDLDPSNGGGDSAEIQVNGEVVSTVRTMQMGSVPVVKAEIKDPDTGEEITRWFLAP